jgi:hypothetical protein
MILANCFSNSANLIQRYLGRGFAGREAFFLRVGLVMLSLLLDDLLLGSAFSISWTLFDIRAASLLCLAILWRSAVVELVLKRPRALRLKPSHN